MSLASYFLSGAMAINASQFLGAPLQLVNKQWYNTWIAWTKESFGLLTMTMTQWWAPTIVKVSGDKSMRGQLTKNPDGTLRCLFPNRIVLVSNHQIYTDWLYLWWIAYTNGMHGRLYIILKESLKNIPVVGWGMQLSQFIFMKRNWEQDKPNMKKHLANLRRPQDPMWLMIFPEGTNLAPDTREKSRAWARKNGIKDMQHQLLPRSTGLHFCLEQLQGSMDYLYDCTIAYEGVGRGQYAQDIFTLKASYLEGNPPKAVHIYWRRFPISDIPLNNPETFSKWLTARWREKDYLLEMWHRNGQFPADVGAEKLANGTVRRGCGHISSQVRPAQWYEFLQIFAPMGVLALVLSVFYGALPDWFMKAATKNAIQADAVSVPQVQVNGAEKPISWLSFLDADKQGGAVQQLLQKLIPSTNFNLANVEPPEEIDRKVNTVTKNFLQQMEDEQAIRKRYPASALKKPKPTQAFSTALQTEKAKRDAMATPAQSSTTSTPLRQENLQRRYVTFAQQLRDEEADRRGSVKTASTSTPTALSRSALSRTSSAGFSQKMKEEEAKRRGSVRSTGSTRPSTFSLPPSNFVDSMKSELAKRNGSVTTGRSQALSTKSQAMSTKSQAPSVKSQALSTKTGTSDAFWSDLKAEESKRKGSMSGSSATQARAKPTPKSDKNATPAAKPAPKLEKATAPPKPAAKLDKATTAKTPTKPVSTTLVSTTPKVATAPAKKTPAQTAKVSKPPAPKSTTSTAAKTKSTASKPEPLKAISANSAPVRPPAGKPGQPAKFDKPVTIATVTGIKKKPPKLGAKAEKT